MKLNLNLNLTKKNIPILSSIGIFLLLYVVGGLFFNGFFSIGVFSNLFYDNAFLGVLAVGMTLVIISGGIDLSVGSVIGFTCTFIAYLVEVKQMNPVLAMFLSLVIGTTAGTLMGFLIHNFKLPAFLVTLVGMFLFRGLAYQVSLESIPIRNELFLEMSQVGLFEYNGRTLFPMASLIFIFMVMLGVYMSHFRKFGRNIYAIGGSEPSAVLMGLPVGRTKIMVYAFSGFCSALGGIVYTFYLQSGYALAGVGMELNVIAAVVIGGTLLTGGAGFIEGTLVGVLILGLIDTILNFYGQLSSWWFRIFIGLLLFLFILLQTWLTRSNIFLKYAMKQQQKRNDAAKGLQETSQHS
ncbi:MAG: sugar ABC transporter permease YjfF [Deltaproteobacteria bacterium]|nr:sugar ABC transporter permease YjfF [Deltaproteobacteria bacterium]